MSFYPIRGAALIRLCLACCSAYASALFPLGSSSLCAQPYYVPPSILDSVRFERGNIADTAAPYEWYEKLTNLPHVLTRESVLRKGVEVTLGEYDTLSSHALNEYENYLRDLEVLSLIRFELETTPGEQKGRKKSPATTDLVVRTEDSWSLLIDTYNEAPDERTAWLLEETNFLGYAKQIGIGGDLQSPSDPLWRGLLTYRDPALFGTALQLNSRLVYSRPATEINFGLGRPFYSDRTSFAYGRAFNWKSGEDRFFFRDRTPGTGQYYSSDTNTSTRWSTKGWVSFANYEKDVFRFSAALDYNHLDLDSGTSYRRLGDNSIGFFLGISSLGGEYVRIKNYEFGGTRLVRIGGQGRISAGKISPVNGGADNMIYFGAEARQSVVWGNFYGFASVQAGTGLRQKQAQFTLQRATASGALPLGPGVLAARVEESIIWRWPRYVLLSIASTNGSVGVRGYDYLDAFGDNRLLGNLEYRLFPVTRLWLWDLGLAAFYDVGGVWDQGELFASTRFHSGAGLGVRLGKSDGIDAGFLRVDVAWNFDKKKIGTISFGVSEAFDVFGTLEYAPPAPYTP